MLFFIANTHKEMAGIRYTTISFPSQPFLRGTIRFLYDTLSFLYGTQPFLCGTQWFLDGTEPFLVGT